MINDVLEKVKHLVDIKGAQYQYDLSHADGKTKIVIEIYEEEAPWETNSPLQTTSSK
ncbi:hypothetical protein D3C75_499640 [compost metagenome]